MALDIEAIKGYIRRTESARGEQRERLDEVRTYEKGPQPGPYKPDKATVEYKLLLERSETNVMRMMLQSISDLLYVEDYRAKDATESARAWKYWQDNKFDSRQGQIFYSAIRDGLAYGTALPGKERGTVVMRGASARRMFALYEDPVEDEWPVVALRLDRAGEVVGLLDDENEYVLGVKPGQAEQSILRTIPHNAGLCPVVRYFPHMDLDGYTLGDVWPARRVQDRINQTAFDLLIAQTYGAFIVRGISGIDQPKDAATGKPKAIELAANRLLTSSDSDMKGWQFDPTPLDGYLNSKRDAIQEFAMTTRTAPHHLVVNMVNLAADAIAAAETGEQNKKLSYQHSFGEQAEQHLRLADAVAGSAPVGGSDEQSQVIWADVGSRSLAQAADALTKLAQDNDLKIPGEALWSRIPGWTKQDTSYAELLQKRQAEQDPMQQMVARLDEHAGGLTGPRAVPNAG